jgi:leucyl aminopeptidase
MCNGPARLQKIDQQFQAVGETIADPFEISTIRREDYDLIQNTSEYENVYQCKLGTSGPANRSHQVAAAFIVIASGLDSVSFNRKRFFNLTNNDDELIKHGNDSERPLTYAHIDIAGAAGKLLFID